jgi:uncharacterized membrane protein
MRRAVCARRAAKLAEERDHLSSPSSAKDGAEKAEKEVNVFRRIERHIQSTTLAGLLELVPLIVTIIVLLFIIGYADDALRSLGVVEGRPWDFPGIGLIVGGVLFYLVGLLISTRPGRKLMDWKSSVLGIVPIVKTIYGVTLQASSSLSSEYRFTRVVFVEWPRDGVIAMGFVTGRAYSRASGYSMAVVYIPTVPNPTSGNLAIVNEDDIVETDLTVEDAMKLVFSGGIVLPEGISLARVPRERTDFELIGRFDTESYKE